MTALKNLIFTVIVGLLLIDSAGRGITQTGCLDIRPDEVVSVCRGDGIKSVDANLVATYDWRGKRLRIHFCDGPPAVLVVGIKLESHAHLPQSRSTFYLQRLLSRFVQGRQENGDQKGNDADDHQQFNKCECWTAIRTISPTTCVAGG